MARRPAVGKAGLVPAEGVRLRLIDDEGVLFDPRRRTVYFLNTAATVIWCQIENGEEISASDGFVTAGAQDIVSQWRSLDLLLEPGAKPQRFPRAMSQTRRRGPRLAAFPPGSQPIRRYYRLLSTDFVLTLDDARLAELVHSPLAHLEIDAPPIEPLTIAIDRHRGRFRLTEAGRVLDTCRAENELAPLIKLHAARVAVARFPHLLALHAGALTRGAGTLLLPAAAGSGKSVLTAALLARGWHYLSDDTTLLDERFAVFGLGYGLTLKEGAWELVGGWFPDLMHQRVHIRPDGQPVRYLAPQDREVAGPDRGARKARWIIYPRFIPSAPAAELTPLIRVEALRLLLENCGWVRPLDWETVNRTVDWLGQISCYRLTYANAEAAAAATENQCRNG